MRDDLFKNKRRNKGIAIAALFHAFALVCFFLFGFEVIDPKPGDIEVSWEIQGVEDAGGDNLKDPTAKQPTPEETHAATQSSAQPVEDEKLATDESSEVIVKSSDNKKDPNKTTSTTKETKKTTTTEESTTEDKVDDKLAALAAALKKGADNPGGKGPDEKVGIEGGPTDGKDKTKGGGGDGQWTVADRKALSVGSQRNDCGKSGTVVIRITINRAGQVIKTRHVDGTTQNACLIKQAIQFAKNVTYVPRTDGPVTNEGDITVKYSLN